MLRTLTYHRVDQPGRTPDLEPGLISATPEAFAWQMRTLKRHYRPVSGAQVVDAIRGEAQLPERAVLVTFDDGYRDFQEFAWPILEGAGVPAVLFVATAFPGDPERVYWWDRLHRALAQTDRARLEISFCDPLDLAGPERRQEAGKRLREAIKRLPADEADAAVDEVCDFLGEHVVRERRILDWDELRAMCRKGLEVAAHSELHPILPRCSSARKEREITASVATLERELGASPPLFAYPNGDCDDESRRLLRALGIELAFTQREGHARIPSVETDPLQLPRTSISPRTTPALFRLRLHTWFGRIDRLRREFGR